MHEEFGVLEPLQNRIIYDTLIELIIEGIPPCLFIESYHAPISILTWYILAFAFELLLHSSSFLVSETVNI